MNRASQPLYYRDKLEQGLAYQDFIAERLHVTGIVVQAYCSKASQRKGENMFGLEIKNDQNMARTGNIYIEYAEKARIREGDYAPSGILRSDNTWAYGIGDYRRFYIFAKSTLKNLYNNREKFSLVEIRKETSLGFLIRCQMADRVCARRYNFDETGAITEVFTGGDKVDADLKDISKPQPFQFVMSF